MKIAGIVAEYNPFHTGHAYQIARTRELLGPDCAVAAVMSGSWVQGGRPAMLDKWTRAKLALLGGVDLVLELPTVWAASSAETFARGAVDLLALTRSVDVLSFGSECGDVEALSQIACCLNTPGYEALVRRYVFQKLPFAAARQRAVEELLGPERAALLSTPNNNLGVEYLRNLERDGWAMGAVTVRREGAPHDSLLQEGQRPRFCSATQIRVFLERGDWDALEPYLPQGGLEVLRAGWNGFPSLARAERAVLARLRTMTAADWTKIPDSGRRKDCPRAWNGRAASAAPWRNFSSGQAQALDPGPHASAAGVGLAGAHGGGPARLASLSAGAGLQHPWAGGPVPHKKTGALVYSHQARPCAKFGGGGASAPGAGGPVHRPVRPVPGDHTHPRPGVDHRPGAGFVGGSLSIASSPPGAASGQPPSAVSSPEVPVRSQRTVTRLVRLRVQVKRVRSQSPASISSRAVPGSS